MKARFDELAARALSHFSRVWLFRSGCSAIGRGATMKAMPNTNESFKFDIHLAVLVLVLAVAATIFARSYVLAENTIYTWDFRGYWAAFQGRAEALLVDPIYTLKQMRWQARDSEYNDLFV